MDVGLTFTVWGYNEDRRRSEGPPARLGDFSLRLRLSITRIEWARYGLAPTEASGANNLVGAGAMPRPSAATLQLFETSHYHSSRKE